MFLEDCETYFKSNCLYNVLGVEKTCSNAELKKGYYKQSMRWHPDKSNLDEQNKELYTTKFQILNKAYTILSDKERRKIYDETGSIDDEVELNEDAVSAWRKVFKKVTKEDIDNFMKEYQGSAEQEKELIEKYNEFGGDLDKIIEHVVGFEDYDELKNKLDDLIEQDVIKSTKKYKSTTSKKKEATRKKKSQKEAEEAEKILKEMDGSSLESMILARNAKRGAQMDTFFDSLAEKYAPKKSKTKK